jgi:hypothetical protein
MSDIDPATQQRIDNIILTFVRDHPDLTRGEIEKRMYDFKPGVVRVALFRLEKVDLIDSRFERHADGKLHQHYFPTSSNPP